MAESITPRILVVDDDPSIHSIYERVFSRENIHLDTAMDGIEATSKIVNGNYTLIFLDLMMPQMSGFQVIQWLKNNHRDLLTNVVVVTALSPEAYGELDRTLVHDLVAKPFDVRVLLDYIEEFLSRKGISWERAGSLPGPNPPRC